MGECVGVFQGMGDEVAVLAAVGIDAAVSVVIHSRAANEANNNR